MFTNEGKKLKEKVMNQKITEEGQSIVDDFEEMLNKWHGINELYDDKLDAYIHEINSHILKNPIGMPPKGVRHFSPSSADSCKRELFHRIRGDKRDNFPQPPFRGRWQRIGTAIGDVIQRDLLFIDKHYKRIVGEDPAFRPMKYKRDGYTFPVWEGFAKKAVKVPFHGYEIPINGQPDGILIYKDGRKVGLEIKSKQTSYSQTGYFSMKGPTESHIAQCKAYSIMYGVDDFIILYVNACRKSWKMTDEEFGKYPDIRPFHIHINKEDKDEVLSYFKEVMEAVENNEPPKVDLEKWMFNRYKTATALSLTEDELEEIKGQVEEAKNKVTGKVPAKVKRKAEDYSEALNFILDVRG